MSCCICNKGSHDSDDMITKDSIIKWKANKDLICQMAASILATREYSNCETQKYAIERAKEIARLVEEDDEI
jgi:hypothetical protein